MCCLHSELAMGWKINGMKKKTRKTNEILVTCQLLAHLAVRFTNWIKVSLTVVQDQYFCCLYLSFQKELDQNKDILVKPRPRAMIQG